MAVYVQVLLPLCCVLLAQGHVMHRKSHNFSPSQPPVHDGVDVNNVYPSNPDLPLRPSLDDRPIDGDVFSYNTQRAYDGYYGDGNYNPGLYAYFPYPRYDNRAFGYPTINNGFNSQNSGYPNAPNAPNGYQNPNGNPSNNHHHAPNGYQNPNGNPSNNHHHAPNGYLNPNENPSNNHHHAPNGYQNSNGNPSYNHNHPANRNNNMNQKQADKQQSGIKDESKPSVQGKQSEVVLPRPDKISSDDRPSNKNSLGLVKQNKDYLLVGSNGNILYLLHEANPPITNPIVVPNTNQQPVGNNVVYVPYNLQQPGNQVYQIVSRQQPTSTNNPMAANRVNLNGYNNVPANPVPNNVPATNPSYVLIYANGQLIQVPGIVLNPPQNVVLPNTVASPNVVYQPGQGNNQMYIQLPNSSPIAGDVTHQRVDIQHPQLVANPNNIPNNNGGSYAAVKQPNTQQTPIATPHNMGNGYAQSHRGNQGSVANSENPNPAKNNNNNQVTNPPNQEKDVNVGGPAGNNVPPTNSQPNLNLSVVGLPTEPSKNAVTNTLDVIPAVMVSPYKDNQVKDKKKEQANAKDVNKK